MSTEPKTIAEKEAYLKEYAGLVWNVGTILVDRRSGEYRGARDADSVEPEVWSYLYENLHSVYDQVGPVIDRIETELFGEDFDASSIEADPMAAQRGGA